MSVYRVARRVLQYSNRTILPSLFLGIGGVLLAAFSSTNIAHAAQVSVPVLEPSIASGELRNKVTISLGIDDPSPAKASIAVLNDDNSHVRIDGEKIAVYNDAAASTISLDWETRRVGDGNYKIVYSAANSSGKKTTQTAIVSVFNKKPIVAIAENVRGRTVAGMVTRSDVTFRVLIDGQEQVDVSPNVVDLENSNVSGWSFLVPDSIKDGSRVIEVYATPEDGVQSDVAMRTIHITPLSETPVIAPAEPGKGEAAVLPPLAFAEQIGEFIAPLIPRSVLSASTSLFGVPVDDIIGDTSQVTPQQDIIAPLNATASATTKSGVLGANDSVVQATESGWKIFGIGWYWFVGLIMVLGISVGVTVRVLRSRRTSLDPAVNI